MKIHARIIGASCPASLSFQTASGGAHDPVNPFSACEKNDFVTLDFVWGQSTLPAWARGNRFIFMMLDLFAKFVVAVPLPYMKAEITVLAFVSSRS